jgi:hypothetical protein
VSTAEVINVYPIEGESLKIFNSTDRNGRPVWPWDCEVGVETCNRLITVDPESEDAQLGRVPFQINSVEGLEKSCNTDLHILHRICHALLIVCVV